MRSSQNLLRVYNMLMRTPSSSPSSVIITIISSSWHLLYNFHRKISRMVRNNFMMHLCTVATLCFFKITFPRNYYYCDQDDTFPWVCVLKYVSNSNRCHRHLEFYIFDVQKFPYLSKYIYQQPWILGCYIRNIISRDLTKKIKFLSVGKKSFLGGMSKLLQLYLGGVRRNDYSIT